MKLYHKAFVAALVVLFPPLVRAQDIEDLTFTTEIDSTYAFGFNLKESRSAKGGIWNLKTGRPDEDTRPWTVVRKGDRIGMIDNTGKVMVPIVFGLYQDVERMVFHMTPRGELAAARDPSTKKHGLIDRHGSWVIQPKYEELAWDGEKSCFYAMSSRYDHGTWMGYGRTDINL